VAAFDARVGTREIHARTGQKDVVCYRVKSLPMAFTLPGLFEVSAISS
jgi:hypothetical protein